MQKNLDPSLSPYTKLNSKSARNLTMHLYLAPELDRVENTEHVSSYLGSKWAFCSGLRLQENWGLKAHIVVGSCLAGGCFREVLSETAEL